MEQALSGEIPFRPRAKLLRLLGEGLISSEYVAVVELVKNAYDADARQVVLSIVGLNEDEGAIIEIRDDGVGMPLETVLNEWMEPAFSSKRVGPKKRSSSGRHHLGEKGVGRFAADKLGERLELVTRAVDEPEILVHALWGSFDDDKYLDEVPVRWRARSPLEFPGVSHGTVLRIMDLRRPWNEQMVQRLREALGRLITPRRLVSGFNILVECDELPALGGPVRSPLLSKAPYWLEGAVDDDGTMSYSASFCGGRKTCDLRSRDSVHFGSSIGLRRPLCGGFALSLHVWDLDAVARGSSLMDRSLRTSLKSVSGVSIYRDGFRVLPYGERGNDWLDLGQSVSIIQPCE